MKVNKIVPITNQFSLNDKDSFYNNQAKQNNNPNKDFSNLLDITIERLNNQASSQKDLVSIVNQNLHSYGF